MTIATPGAATNGDPNTPNPPTTQLQVTHQEPVEHDETTPKFGPSQEVDNVDFPLDPLNKLEEMISRPRWVVPVLPSGELETLLDASISLCRRGVDTSSAACQRFFRDGLTISFNKILTDEAVSGWKFDIHKCIMDNCRKLVELCVLKLGQDWFPLLELLAMAFNPSSKFHIYNSNKPSETVPPGSSIADEDTFARSYDTRAPKGWLVDLVNQFGQMGGFQIVLNRFTTGGNLNVPVIAAHLKPFGLCSEVLTPHTVEKFFMPVLDLVHSYLDKLTDEELKRESKSDSKTETPASVIKSMKRLAMRLAKQEDIVKDLELFRLRMILRLLKISSFSGKMNTLNDLNKVITNVSYYPHRHNSSDDEEWLTADKMAEWIQTNSVLDIVLRDNLHQPQYVEKLEKLLRFMIKEKALTTTDLDQVWEAQAGKHEAIVKNIHDLLAKLAWDFSPEQLDYLFGRFQQSWQAATKKQQEKLLELIRRLAEDDKEGIMANKVLGLLWNLAHSTDVPTDIMDQALLAHIKILDYSASQDRDNQKMQWVNRFVQELQDEQWVIPALRQIRDICALFPEMPQNYGSHIQRSPQVMYRNQIIGMLQSNNQIVMSVSTNLTNYMDKMRAYVKDHPDSDPDTVLPDNRFNHIQQINERLRFLRFLLKDGQLWLCEPQARQVWLCLAVNGIWPCDRDSCFNWFSKLMGDEPDLDPDILKDFMEKNILKYDPGQVTESGMICFERFFKQVNMKENKLVVKRRGGLVMNDLDLVGLDYVWKLVLYSCEPVASKAVQLLREVQTCLGPSLAPVAVQIHHDFIECCIDRLRSSYDTISVLDRSDPVSLTQALADARRMSRVLTVLKEYVAECDESYGDERALVPLSRAHHGKHLALLVRFPSQGRQAEDVEIWTHSNETLGAVRRNTLVRVKAANVNVRLDLYINNDLLDPVNDKKILSQLGIKDKMLLTGKLTQVGAVVSSTASSSSDSSPSPGHLYDGPNREAEMGLPGVILANSSNIVNFIVQICDLGCSLEAPELTEQGRVLLKLIPADASLCKKLREICFDHEKAGVQLSLKLEELFFNDSPHQTLYNLEVLYSLLLPANVAMYEDAFEFQRNFFLSGGQVLCLSMLTRTHFLLKADLATRRQAYLVLLRLLKLTLTTCGHATVHMVAEAYQADTHKVLPEYHQAAVLQQTLTHVPHPGADLMLKNVAVKLGQSLGGAVAGFLPDLTVVCTLQRLAWACSYGAFQLMHVGMEEVQRESLSNKHTLVMSEDVLLSTEALEVLTLCLALVPQLLEHLNKERCWQDFIIYILITCSHRSVRLTAVEQFHIIATKCNMNHRTLVFFITLLFTVLENKVRECSTHCHEYFRLLCTLLHHAFENQTRLTNVDTLLNNEITWLRKLRDTVCKTGDVYADEFLLEGRLLVTKELVQFQPAPKKFYIGSSEEGPNLIRDLIEDFLFPASKVVLSLRRSGSGVAELADVDHAIPVCHSPITTIAAFKLLTTLSSHCIQNLRKLSTMITDMYLSSHDAPLTDWEYMPPIGCRPIKGFVGLKNAGATCYMNSVLQQLFMIDTIRTYVLNAETGSDENLEELDYKQESMETDTDVKSMSGLEDRKSYNIRLLQYVQLIFGHLACSKLQYYVPRGFWKHFRLQGEAVNLREQHDALEFFTSLVDSLDEGLKTLNYRPVFSKVMGGSFADQKICKGCPHRYSREESFLTLSIDIRNHHNLLESLEQYVKGDLLEGANAYHCERCNYKVDTVKRMCIKKLPPILAIQLKRFDYDWERECAVKFNDYFEFPREFDMEPYTVQGLAKIEGEVISDGDEDTEKQATMSTKYRLCGVVVHSGQASGGHYYSFIQHRAAEVKWYRFDDGDVSECKMDDDEEMRNQCFGGEYIGETFEQHSKRKQKRWWNAYILFYERLDGADLELAKDLMNKSMQDLSIENRTTQVRMPRSVEKIVRGQNLLFAHNKMLYSVEFFHFMRDFLICNQPDITRQPPAAKLSHEQEEVSLLCVQLSAKFLFNIGLRTKKNLRGSAIDWYDSLAQHLHYSPKIRTWFTQNVFFSHPNRFSEFLLECPSSEVRTAMMRLLVFLAHFSHQDGPATPCTAGGLAPLTDDPAATLGDHLIIAILNLLKKEVSEFGRHLAQYFHLFLMYANLGVTEKQHLLRLDVPMLFMHVALDEGPGPPIKYQYTELSKLYAVVSQLIRCYDLSTKCTSSAPTTPPLPNPHGDLVQPLMMIPDHVADLLLNRTSYVKKLLEDCTESDETVKLLRYCSWENPHFSSTVLSELLWQVAYSYTYELRPYLDLLLQMLVLEDSWQTHRIHNALKGITDDRDGLFDTIQRSKGHYQKRAYQCIKMMVTLFSHCSAAAELLKNDEIKRKWRWSVEWLNDELERRPYGSQYNYGGWNPHAQSNETTNGYFLERSHSAKITLAKAVRLCPEESDDPKAGSGDEQDPPTVSPPTVSPPSYTDSEAWSPPVSSFRPRTPPTEGQGSPTTSPSKEGTPSSDTGPTLDNDDPIKIAL